MFKKIPQDLIVEILLFLDINGPINYKKTYEIGDIDHVIILFDLITPWGLLCGLREYTGKILTTILYRTSNSKNIIS